MALVAEPRRGEREHAAQLSAAENADGGIGPERAGTLRDHALSSGASATASVCFLRQASSRFASFAIAQCQHAGGEQRRVDRAGLADRERADRHAGRHLHDGVERIDARHRLGLDRNAEHRERGHGGGHAGEVGGAARAGDDDLVPGSLRAARERIEPVRRAVRRDDALVIGHAERVQRLGGVPHGRPVGLAAHDDRDGFGRHARPLVRHRPKRRRHIGEPASGRQADTPR